MDVCGYEQGAEGGIMASWKDKREAYMQALRDVQDVAVERSKTGAHEGETECLCFICATIHIVSTVAIADAPEEALAHKQAQQDDAVSNEKLHHRECQGTGCTQQNCFCSCHLNL